MRDKIHITLTEEHREIISAHGPYELKKNGTLVDRSGVALCLLRSPNAEETEWDRAVLEALNEIAEAQQ